MNEIDSLIPSLLTSTSDDYRRKPNDTPKFKIRRTFIFTIVVICDVLVYFQRSCSTVLADDMAKSYGVDSSKIGIFSSLFYYPYSILQPFSGLLADVVEPSYLVCGSTLVGGFGAFLCGMSKSLSLGYFGRFITGIGTALVYCPANRIMMNWYPLSQYAQVSGVFLFIAGCGALLAQAPLAILAEHIGWRWCFHIIAITSLIFSILTFLFVKGNPVSLDYEPVNRLLAEDSSKWTISEKWHKLVHNFKTVLSCPSFWILGFFAFFTSGVFYNLSGSWGCAYLMDVFGYSKVKSSYILLSLSIGTNLGSLFLPYMHDLIKSKKINCIIWTVLGTLSCIPFIFFSGNNQVEANGKNAPTLEIFSILFLFFILSIPTAALWVSYYPMLTEYYHPEAAATASGWLNGFCFFSSPVFMPLTGIILKHFGHVPGSTTKYRTIGYVYGLWVFSTACMAVSLIFICLAKDPKGKSYQDQDYFNPEDPESVLTIN